MNIVQTRHKVFAILGEASASTPSNNVNAASFFTDAFITAHSVARMTGFYFDHLLVHTCVEQAGSCSLLLILDNNDTDFEVSDTCSVRNSLLS